MSKKSFSPLGSMARQPIEKNVRKYIKRRNEFFDKMMNMSLDDMIKDARPLDLPKRKIKEDENAAAPTNSAGGGNIAGFDPLLMPGVKKRKKLLSFRQWVGINNKK